MRTRPIFLLFIASALSLKTFAIPFECSALIYYNHDGYFKTLELQGMKFDSDTPHQMAERHFKLGVTPYLLSCGALSDRNKGMGCWLERPDDPGVMSPPLTAAIAYNTTHPFQGSWKVDTIKEIKNYWEILFSCFPNK